MIINTLAQRREAATRLLRVKPTAMSHAELDLGLALLLEKTIELPTILEDGPVLTLSAAGEFMPFSPMTNWEHFGELLCNTSLVTGSHPLFENEANYEEITGYRYSCHGFFSGVKTDGYDLREVVAQTAIKLLEHNLSYSDRWTLQSDTGLSI